LKAGEGEATLPIPTYQELKLPLLKLVGEGEISRQDAVQRLIKEFQLTPEEATRKILGGQTMIYNRTGWASMELVKAGLIQRPRRGVFGITDQGRALLADPPAIITRAILAERYPEFRDFLEASRQGGRSIDGGATGTPAASDVEPAETTPDEQIETASKTLTAALEAELIERIRTVHPTQFEQIVVDLLVAMGFGGGDPEMGQRLGRSNDGGIDGVIQEDALGLDAVYIQAKRYQDGNTIGAPMLQGFVGSLIGNRATKGVFVTSSRFSPAAKQYVQTIQHRVVLIDGEELARLLVRHGVGVREDRRIVIKKIDEDYFNE